MRMRQLIEARSDWSEKWVHYSDRPYLKIHPRPIHQDPVGLYFFPADFSPASMWRNKPYRYEVRLKPDARVLDVSQMTQEQLDHLIDTVGVRKQYDNEIASYPKSLISDRFDMAWEAMKAARWEMGLSPARWNKRLREAGWDAIFDDTGSIHIVEVQLLVLDPRMIEITNVVRQKLNGYAAMMKVIDDLVAVCKPFGEVTTEPVRRRIERISSGYNLEARVEVKRDEDTYASFTITHRIGDMVSPIVVASLSWSSPRLSYGVGATYRPLLGKYENNGMSKLEPDLERIFKSQSRDQPHSA